MSPNQFLSVYNDSSQYLLALFCEKNPNVSPAKTGIDRIAYKMLTSFCLEGSELDTVLTSFAKERFAVAYRRVEVDLNDNKFMASVGLSWLPQVRLIRNQKTLLRSSIVMGTSGEFLVHDVGGLSYRRNKEKTQDTLVEALGRITDKVK